MTELQEAIILANKRLDDASADPDSDLSLLARQFLRSHERVVALEGRSLAYLNTLRWVCRNHLVESAVLVSELSADCIGQKLLARLEAAEKMTPGWSNDL